jgi:hypothetical protein
MQKQKRAPGGGRKPKGEFRGLTVSTSWRMPADLYDLLEHSRKLRSEKRGREFSLGQELLFRLRDSFSRERDAVSDREARSINHAIRNDADSRQALYRLTKRED